MKTVVLVLLVLTVVGCGAPKEAVQAPAASRNADGYVDIAVSDLAQMLEKKDFALVNVHVPYEGEIRGTDLFIAYDQLAANMDKLPDKEARIVLYCRSGSMSASAARELASLGYTQVMELDGGFQAWKAAGHELIHK